MRSARTAERMWNKWGQWPTACDMAEVIVQLLGSLHPDLVFRGFSQWLKWSCDAGGLT